jgi:hypothetical protein
MTKSLRIVLFVGLVGSAFGQLPAQCLPSGPTDSTAAALATVKSQLVQLVTATDTGTARMRSELNIPSLLASDVTIVTSAQTCAKAASALAALTTGGSASDGAWVFSLGTTRYFAFNGKQKGAGNTYAVIFDRKFVKLSSVPF